MQTCVFLALLFIFLKLSFYSLKTNWLNASVLESMLNCKDYKRLLSNTRQVPKKRIN